MNNAGILLSIVGFVAGGIIVVLALTLDWTPRPKAVRSVREISFLTRQQQIWGVAGLGVGLVLFFITGWVVMLITAPIAGVFLPSLLGRGDAPKKIERLEALETWTRSLSGLTTAGSIGLEQVLIASLASSPEPIKPQVNSLVARLNARWPTRDALEAFAADFDDSTADLIVMHLLLKEASSGPGLTKALDDLAEIIGEEVKVRRGIETDRQKPRTQIRIVTMATLVILAILPFLGTYTAAYSTFIGQLLLGVWVILFAVLLWWMRNMSLTKGAPRLLAGPDESEANA